MFARGRNWVVALATSCLVPGLAIQAQQPNGPRGEAPQAKKAETRSVDSATIEKIKDEGLNRSQVMKTLTQLTDVNGPRLTGSPGLYKANEWTRDAMKGWGLQNAHLEKWGPFGKGWTLKRFSMQVSEPLCIPLIAYPKAWSVGTNGTVTAPVVLLDAKTEKDLEKYKGKLKGAIVLTSPVREVTAHFEPQGTRHTDTQLLDMANADPSAPRARRPQGGPPAATPKAAEKGQAKAAEKAAPKAAEPPATSPRMAEMMAAMALQRIRLPFLVKEEVAAIVDPSTIGDGGTLFVAQASAPGAAAFGGGGGGRRISVWDKDAPKNVPQITVSKEHYNRLVRMVEAGEKLTVSLDLAVEFHDKDLNAYNTIAEIPGTDPALKDEIVMLGGHLDSWHSGTGATDNAAGCAVGMEAVRLIQTLGLKPKRTIRIALWTGEEQGLLGSAAYVAEHFGKAERTGGGGGGGMFGGGGPATPPKVTKGPEYDKFSVYFNLDNGTGKIRGVYMQGNEATRAIFRPWLSPFKDMGASTLTASNTGGTDHLSFDGIGLPGFQFIQDEIEYDTRTHHSNQDVYDRIQADDMKQASIVMAAFVLNAANRDEKFPRKPVTFSSETPAKPAAKPAAVGGGAR